MRSSTRASARTVSPTSPSVAERLRAEADRYLASRPAWEGETKPLELDELQLNQLRALGYAVPVSRAQNVTITSTPIVRGVPTKFSTTFEKFARVERVVLVDLVLEVAAEHRDLDVAGRRAIGQAHVVQPVGGLADRELGQPRGSLDVGRRGAAPLVQAEEDVVGPAEVVARDDRAPAAEIERPGRRARHLELGRVQQLIAREVDRDRDRVAADRQRVAELEVEELAVEPAEVRA